MMSLTSGKLQCAVLPLAMLTVMLTMAFAPALSASSYRSSTTRLLPCFPQGSVVRYNAAITGPVIPWKAVPATTTSASIMWGAFVPQSSDASSSWERDLMGHSSVPLHAAGKSIERAR
jgi:hypothetical protein